MWDIVLQQCRTADQAVDLVEQMAGTRGFSGGAAGSYAVADQNEAWVIEVLGGHHWVAARVPNDAFYAQPNMLRIRQIDLSKPGKFRGSPDLEQFAISRRPLQSGRAAPSTSPGRTASVPVFRTRTTPTACGAPSTRSRRRSILTCPCPMRIGPSSSSRTTR